MSPAALIGALDGSGTVTLEDAAFSWLDPKAFNAAVRSADQGAAIDAAKVRDVVGTVLDGGNLAVPRLDAALTIQAGQARAGHTIIPAQGADLALAGSVDLADATLDARLTLTGPVLSDGSSTARPDILVMLKGPLAAPKRTVDVSALSGWLMLRSVDRQAKRLDAIESERRDAAAREPEPAPAISPPVSAALPAPAPPDAAPEPAPARPQRAPRPATTSRAPALPPAAEQLPALPPPLEISPAPANARPHRAPRPSEPRQNTKAPPPTRSTLDTIFGPLR
jgi:large subunit ribosomal protein L24